MSIGKTLSGKKINRNAGYYLQMARNTELQMPNRENALENYLKKAKDNVPDQVYRELSNLFSKENGSRYGSEIILEHQTKFRT